ncbi:MAG: transporter [Chloracidobacterium sp.]|nr:transporter [Chloracidobacterium sp.]
MKQTFATLCLLLAFSSAGAAQNATDQQESLERRQPLELLFADSIVPQDRHEMMLTTGGWRFRRGVLREAAITQKIEWGISDRLQVSTFAHLVNSSNQAGPTAAGMGDIEIGARYTWPTLGSQFTHLAIALDAGFPTGDPRRGLGEGTYSLSPSVLFSRELQGGKRQLFTTTGMEFIVKRRQIGPLQEKPRNSIFSNSGASFHAGHGWIVGEISVSFDRWNGGSNTSVTLTPSYVWRLASRAELLFGVPLGFTPSTNRLGAVIKFTFELGGRDD